MTVSSLAEARRHGEEPHMLGWRSLNAHRAINLDLNCGWARRRTDVFCVANAFSLMKKVNGPLAK